MKKHEIE